MAFRTKAKACPHLTRFSPRTTSYLVPPRHENGGFSKITSIAPERPRSAEQLALDKGLRKLQRPIVHPNSPRFLISKGSGEISEAKAFAFGQTFLAATSKAPSPAAKSAMRLGRRTCAAATILAAIAAGVYILSDPDFLVLETTSKCRKVVDQEFIGTN